MARGDGKAVGSGGSTGVGHRLTQVPAPLPPCPAQLASLQAWGQLKGRLQGCCDGSLAVLCSWQLQAQR